MLARLALRRRRWFFPEALDEGASPSARWPWPEEVEASRGTASLLPLSRRGLSTFTGDAKHSSSRPGSRICSPLSSAFSAISKERPWAILACCCASSCRPEASFSSRTWICCSFLRRVRIFFALESDCKKVLAAKQVSSSLLWLCMLCRLRKNLRHSSSFVDTASLFARALKVCEVRACGHSLAKCASKSSRASTSISTMQAGLVAST
mmetsp:Transcript_8739/g.32234  ORF Transcript_8739/g.32234 Transcript_8739/m.32234 type:complete len:208 (-) Transcript_8739:2059-2682(-)